MKFLIALLALFSVSLFHLPSAFATADSIVRNANGFFAKNSSDSQYYPAMLCFSTDGSQKLIPCGKVPGGYGIAPIFLDTSSTNVTSSAYVQLVASTAAAATWVNVFNGSAQPLVLAVGASSSEVDKIGIPASGSTGGVNLYIPAGSRLSVKSKGSTASSGLLIVNLLQ